MIDPLSRLKGMLLRWSCPLFYKHIGRGCIFYGHVRLPLPLRNVTIGDRCVIGHSVFFHSGRNSHIVIGDDSSFNSGCHVVALQSIIVGENVAIGEYVSIRDHEHSFSPAHGVRDRGYCVEPVIIGNNVWIGRGVYIGPGVRIGSGCIVGANSVVRGVFPDNVLIAGAPAVIKKTLS